MPELKPGSSRCMCGECGLFFSGTSLFDEHRKGGYGDDEVRYCLTGAELAAAGFVCRDEVWGWPPPKKGQEHWAKAETVEEEV